MSIKVKLIILFLALVIIPLFFVSLISYVNSKDALERATLRTLHLVAELRESEILIFLDDIKKRTINFSSEGAIKDLLQEAATAKKGEIEKKFIKYLSEHEAFNDKDIVAIDVVDLSGHAIASSDPLRVGRDYRKESSFLHGKTRAYTSDIKKNEEGVVEFSVAAPVMSHKKDRVIGVWVTHYYEGTLDGILTGEKVLRLGAMTQVRGVGKTGESYIVNQNELMITSSLFLEDVILNQKVDTYPVKKGLEENKEMIGIWPDYRGIPVAGASMVLHIEDFTWVLLSEQDVSEAVIPAHDLSKILTVIVITTSLLIILIALLISQSISRPIRALQKGAEIIGGGNLDYKVGTKDKDEIGQLSRGFDKMTETLKKTTASRDSLNKEISIRKQVEENLVVAKKTAEDASRTKSDFLANMSHELRTPLNAIIGFSEVLRDEAFGQLNDKQKEYNVDVLNSGKHLLSLINDILDLSKVEAGKAELSLSDFDLKMALENSLSMIKEKALKHNIAIVKNIKGDIGTIRADERKFKQIMFNLLSNAAKFTPDGGKIGIEAKMSDKNIVLVTVWDTGIGIEEKDKSKVFKEFEQIESSHSRKYAGTGLGMPLAKKFVELHKGKMWFESGGKDKGAHFYFTLPLKGGK
ncbi:MAG: ATP-binding protein [Omnitrophica bacterium]|nr:ATP-binding protein [Candidatus Omnitrophota bacterium]